LRSPNDIADRDAYSRIFACHIHRIDLDQVAEILLERTLDKVLRSGSELAAVWPKNQAKQPGAEIWTVHSFSGRGEKHLLDQIADVRVVIDFSRPAARIEVIWEVNVHVAMTRVCVTITFNGVPVGAQIATLVCVNTGCPLARTRVAATTHCAVTHGPFPPGGTNGQPATTYGTA
jgi:hypothetical protein